MGDPDSSRGRHDDTRGVGRGAGDALPGVAGRHLAVDAVGARKRADVALEPGEHLRFDRARVQELRAVGQITERIEGRNDV
jgi:hypothetical protein